MVIIHTAEDIIRAMDENPEWLEAVRARVLTREVLELPRRFEELRAVVEQMAATQNQMLETQKQHTATLAHLNGGEVERLLGKQIYGMLGGYPLRMRRVRVLRGYYWTHGMDRFNGALEEANDVGKISDDQHARLIHTDFIASMRRREGEEDVYIVIEASRKINRHDVDRAIRSRDAMQAAFDGAEALAAVYGWEISAEDRRYAESNGATVFISAPEI